MANITYLIGAGASADALPVVNDISDNINILLKKLGQLQRYYDISPRDKEVLTLVIRELGNLYVGCINHASIDTYAKMLFLKNDEIQYFKTKTAIILFFELYRFFNNNTFDKRYDAFFASILNKISPRFPKNIQFISWNYDYEFEKAFLSYSENANTIEDVYNELNVHHKNGNTLVPEDSFSITKINGTAGFFEKSNIKLGLGNTRAYAIGDETVRLINDIRPLLEDYLVKSNQDMTANIQPAISFAWEGGEGQDFIMEKLKRTITNSDILVIIGYSFPYFNRHIDKAILGSFGALKRIYIQDKNPEELINAVAALSQRSNSHNIIPIKNTNQFYMPHEL